jgi:arylsulfatase A-like enzyme
MYRRSLSIPLVLNFAMLFPVAFGCSGDHQELQPNVILVMVDALRRDHLGVYGYDQPTSPYLDKLAAEGLVFDDAWSQGSQTIMSTASFLTSSLFPPVTSISRDDVSSSVKDRLQGKSPRMAVLVSEGSSFPEVLSNAGYSTVALLTNPHHNRYSGFPDLFDVQSLLLDGEAISTEKEIPYATGAVVLETFLEWLSQRHPPHQPYMAYIHLMDVHNPYRPPPEFREKYVKSTGVDRYRNAIPSAEEMPSTADLEFMIQSYDAEIAYVDSLIRKMHTAALAASSRPVVLVVTSDHGDEFLEHGGLGHGRTLEMELLRVPLIVNGGEIVPRRENGLVRLVDVSPSLLELAEIPIPQHWHGKPLFLAAPQSSEISESVANYGGLMSITTGDWHAIWDRRADTVVLYDRGNDPQGLTDVADKFPDVVGTFRERFSSIEEERVAVRRGANEKRDDLIDRLNAVDIGDETEQQLRALGYVN